MKKYSDERIVESWAGNVNPWISAVRNGEIQSRIQVTNKAIVDAVLERAPDSVLDAGCGEGWLVRELAKAGIKCLGLDVVTEFVECANKEGGGIFRSLSFEKMTYDVLAKKFDVVVCNFSLLGKESVIRFFKQTPSLLKPKGAFIIQTTHPVSGGGEDKYEDGWREGSWAGFSQQFSDPAPWYFRTMETWCALFSENGFNLTKVIEPMHPETKNSASVIFVGVVDHDFQKINKK